VHYDRFLHVSWAYFTKHRKYLEENVAAVGITLTREDLARIEEVAAGERYADANMSVVNR
jgi:diketogulonate reductase-like aldo/keto reductase